MTSRSCPQLKVPPSYELDGKVVLVHATDLIATKKLIPDLATWVQYFVMYMAVIATRQPEHVPDMMAYIAKCSMKFYWPAVMVYNQNVRGQAADIGITSCAMADPNLYAQIFTANVAISAEGWCKHCHSVDHTSLNCPSQPPPATLPEKRAAPLPVTAQPSKRSKIICNMMVIVISDQVSSFVTFVAPARKGNIHPLNAWSQLLKKFKFSRVAKEHSVYTLIHTPIIIVITHILHAHVNHRPVNTAVP